MTKNGYGDLVVMSVETYNEMLNTMAQDKAISESEEEFAQSGELFELDQALKELKEQHLGKV